VKTLIIIDMYTVNKMWRECVDEDMKKLGLSKEMAQDRSLWRSYLHGNRPACASTEKRTLRR
jgi:hypothetical protein